MSSEDQDFSRLIKLEFLEEATFLLDEWESGLLQLEDPSKREVEIAKIFRLVHSLKGTGTAVGFLCIAGLAHVVEDSLSIVRVYPDLIDATVISLLLESLDALKVRVTMLKSGKEDGWDADELRKKVISMTVRLKDKSQKLGQNFEVEPNIAMAANSKQNSDVLVNTSSHLPQGDGSTHASSSSTQSDPTGVSMGVGAVVRNDETASSRSVSGAVDRKREMDGQTPATTSQNSGQTSAQNSIRVETDRIEKIFNIVGELVVIKSQLLNQTAQHPSDLRLNAIVSLMDKTIRDLQGQTFTIRMTPFKGLFMKTQRALRDLSVKLGKPVEVKISGEDTEIDRNMVELLADPIMHIVRNSLDHGIEKVEQRKAKGKSEKGLISISAQQVGSRILIQVEDDGAGIPRKKILEKALEKGLVKSRKEIESMTDKQVLELIFHPGFSTAEKITQVSGRGVGMDVVKTNIEKIKGTIDIESVEGQGTIMTVYIPITTAVTDGMITAVNDQLMIMPLDTIREIVFLKNEDFFEIESGKWAFNHRGVMLPILDLESTLLSALDDREIVPRNSFNSQHMAILVEVKKQKVALLVDRISDQTQVVLKPLGQHFKQTEGVAGAAILGDGAVALVIDPVGVVTKYHFGEMQENAQEKTGQKVQIEKVEAA